MSAHRPISNKSSCSVLTAVSVLSLAACTSSSGQRTVGDSGAAIDSGTTDAGACSPVNSTGATMYARYGNCLSNVQYLVTAVATAAGANETTGPFFTAVVGQPGFDTQTELADCLVTFFAAAMGGTTATGTPITYPGVNTTPATPNGTGIVAGSSCANMQLAHAPLNAVKPINAAVFNTFATVVQSTLTNLTFPNGGQMSNTDITALMTILGSYQSQVVAADGGTTSEAGTDSGSRDAASGG